MATLIKLGLAAQAVFGNVADAGAVATIGSNGGPLDGFIDEDYADWPLDDMDLFLCAMWGCGGQSVDVTNISTKVVVKVKQIVQNININDPNLEKTLEALLTQSVTDMGNLKRMIGRAKPKGPLQKADTLFGLLREINSKVSSGGGHDIPGPMPGPNIPGQHLNIWSILSTIFGVADAVEGWMSWKDLDRRIGDPKTQGSDGKPKDSSLTQKIEDLQKQVDQLPKTFPKIDPATGKVSEVAAIIAAIESAIGGVLGGVSLKEIKTAVGRIGEPAKDGAKTLFDMLEKIEGEIKTPAGDDGSIKKALQSLQDGQTKIEKDQADMKELIGEPASSEPSKGPADHGAQSFMQTGGSDAKKTGAPSDNAAPGKTAPATGPASGKPGAPAAEKKQATLFATLSAMEQKIEAIAKALNVNPQNPKDNTIVVPPGSQTPETHSWWSIVLIISLAVGGFNTLLLVVLMCILANNKNQKRESKHVPESEMLREYGTNTVPTIAVHDAANSDDEEEGPLLKERNMKSSKYTDIQSSYMSSYQTSDASSSEESEDEMDSHMPKSHYDDNMKSRKGDLESHATSFMETDAAMIPAEERAAIEAMMMSEGYNGMGATVATRNGPASFVKVESRVIPNLPSGIVVIETTKPLNEGMIRNVEKAVNKKIGNTHSAFKIQNRVVPGNDVGVAYIESTIQIPEATLKTIERILSPISSQNNEMGSIVNRSHPDLDSGMGYVEISSKVPDNQMSRIEESFKSQPESTASDQMHYPTSVSHTAALKSKKGDQAVQFNSNLNSVSQITMQNSPDVRGASREWANPKSASNRSSRASRNNRTSAFDGSEPYTTYNMDPEEQGRDFKSEHQETSKPPSGMSSGVLNPASAVIAQVSTQPKQESVLIERK